MEEYETFADRIVKSKAETVVNGIIADMCDRGGLQNEWEAIDPETQNEIKKAWTDIVLSEFSSEAG